MVQERRCFWKTTTRSKRRGQSSARARLGALSTSRRAFARDAPWSIWVHVGSLLLLPFRADLRDSNYFFCGCCHRFHVAARDDQLLVRRLRRCQRDQTQGSDPTTSGSERCTDEDVRMSSKHSSAHCNMAARCVPGRQAGNTRKQTASSGRQLEKAERQARANDRLERHSALETTGQTEHKGEGEYWQLN